MTKTTDAEAVGQIREKKEYGEIIIMQKFWNTIKKYCGIIIGGIISTIACILGVLLERQRRTGESNTGEVDAAGTTAEGIGQPGDCHKQFDENRRSVESVAGLLSEIRAEQQRTEEDK